MPVASHRAQFHKRGCEISDIRSSLAKTTSEDCDSAQPARQAPPWNRQNRRVKQAIPILLGLRKFLGEAFDDDPVNSRLKGEYAGHVNRDSTLNAISQVTRELEDAVIVSAADNPPGYVWAGKLREERFKVA